MLNTISEIQPHFKLVYDHGANFLSVAVDDREGAKIIFDKGLKLYPNDWRLNFNAAYLYLWELQDAQRAAELLEASIHNGGPPLASTLVASIYSESGRAEFAKLALLDALQRSPTPQVKQAIEKKLELINQVLEKKSTNSP